jgi:hypothetical protein
MSKNGGTSVMSSVRDMVRSQAHTFLWNTHILYCFNCFVIGASGGLER